MKAKNGKQVTRGLLTSLLGVAACFVAVPLGHTQTGAETSVAQSPTPSGTAGWKVYVDPQTGVIRDGPAPGTVPPPSSPQEQNASSTSSEGLVQVPSPVPGGGVGMDLQGRFQSRLIGTIGADGKVKIHH